MGGQPETFYTDNEGSFSSKEIQAYFKEHNIRWLSTNTHAGVVERLIRTIKNYIYKRAEHYKKPWWEYIYSSMLTYNHKSVHSVTKHTPADARKPANEFQVRLNLLVNNSLAQCLHWVLDLLLHSNPNAKSWAVCQIWQN